MSWQSRIVLAALLATSVGCGPGAFRESNPVSPEALTASPTTFVVRLENVTPFQLLKSGTFAVPVGANAPGGIGSNGAFEFEFTAAPGQRLSFASMLGASSDWIVAPSSKGIPLFENGTPVSGDVTAALHLYDVGTEVDEEPGVGPHTGPKQGSAAGGPFGGADPDANVRRLSGAVVLADGTTFTLPPISQMLKATLTARGNDRFLFRLENVSTAHTLMTTEGDKPVGFSPGVWALSDGGEPLFTEGAPDRGQGLKELAEFGRNAALAAALRPIAGVPTGLSPGLIVVHQHRGPLFTLGHRDHADGLERIAEDGMPDELASSLRAKLGGTSALRSVAVFDTPVGRENPSAALPGRAFQVQVTAMPGDRLSFATMFGASNDWFFASVEGGVPLFDEGGQPLYGPITGDARLYDLGTELSEEPGVGRHTGPRQSAPDMGVADTDPRAREVTDGEYAVPVSSHLSIVLSRP